LESIAINREAGRDLAKYIAENYFDDPKEAKAFVDKINEYIKTSELQDLGYEIYNPDFLHFYIPSPPSAELLFAQKLGYDISNILCFGPAGFSDDMQLFFNQFESRADYYAFHKKYTEYEIERNTKHPLQIIEMPKCNTFEELKKILCDPRYDQDSEEHKAWYAEFLKKIKPIQNILDNAKSITDFSGNDGWNIVMNLLSNKIGETSRK